MAILSFTTNDEFPPLCFNFNCKKAIINNMKIYDIWFKRFECKELNLTKSSKTRIKSNYYVSNNSQSYKSGGKNLERGPTKIFY